MKQTKIEKILDLSIVRFAVIVSIILASASLFGLLSLNFAIKRGAKVGVPNVVSKSVVEALDSLSERNLELRKTDSRNSALIPQNHILSQDPIPGTVVKEGSPVSVVISLGSQVSLVPNLVNRSLREARVDLNRASLGVGRFTKMHHGSGPDIVLAQWPSPNEQVISETPVDMLVSLGPRPREYRLPNLVGQSMERANTALEAMGVALGDITTIVDLSRPQGIVLDQEPPSGSLVREGSSISLVTSSWHREGEQIKRKFAAFLYQAPYGFSPKSVRIKVSDPDGDRTIYDEVDEPGAAIKLVFGYWAQCTVTVYIDNSFEMERTYR
jgi:serine/threonine-protein kinase